MLPSPLACASTIVGRGRQARSSCPLSVCLSPSPLASSPPSVLRAEVKNAHSTKCRWTCWSDDGQERRGPTNQQDSGRLTLLHRISCHLKKHTHMIAHRLGKFQRRLPTGAVAAGRTNSLASGEFGPQSKERRRRRHAGPWDGQTELELSASS